MAPWPARAGKCGSWPLGNQGLGKWGMPDARGRAVAREWKPHRRTGQQPFHGSDVHIATGEAFVERSVIKSSALPTEVRPFPRRGHGPGSRGSTIADGPPDRLGHLGYRQCRMVTVTAGIVDLKGAGAERRNFQRRLGLRKRRPARLPFVARWPWSMAVRSSDTYFIGMRAIFRSPPAAWFVDNRVLRQDFQRFYGNGDAGIHDPEWRAR